MNRLNFATWEYYLPTTTNKKYFTDFLFIFPKKKFFWEVLLQAPNIYKNESFYIRLGFTLKSNPFLYTAIIRIQLSKGMSFVKFKNGNQMYQISSKRRTFPLFPRWLLWANFCLIHVKIWHCCLAPIVWSWSFAILYSKEYFFWPVCQAF